MKSTIKNILKEGKRRLKKTYYLFQYFVNKFIGPQKHPLDFDPVTLPFLDRPDYSFAEINKRIDPFGKLPYNLEEKLDFFRENGYVVLENVLPTNEVDAIWDEIEYVTENHENYDIDGLAHRFNDQKDTPIKLIPKEKLKGIGTRFIDFHDSSIRSKNLITHPNLIPFLQASLTPKITVFQSLIFKYSSQQDVHQDFPWVTTEIPSHLVAAWIPMEDVHKDSGPLFYYPKSHRIPKFDFGQTGIVFQHLNSLFSPSKFARYLTKTCTELGLKKEVLLIKKGDMLFWHGALAHGGMPINDPTKTRKSFVVHYSTTEGLSKHRNSIVPEENPDQYHGVTIYSNPKLAHQKDIVK